ncbi:MAG: DUF262 domain-containing HNH endonuclease family protein [Bacteroidales bacterium]|nr:DUF262 domain-containing HNH endonuclease family protein [Bacteroidales bacterium]
MSKLNIDQKSIKSLFSDNKSDFLIPDYQRPYAWQIAECQTLWEDTFSFAIPENDYQKFKSGDEYFLGPIVTFKNSDGKLEIIDGQQRLTTLMLLLRALYTHYLVAQDAQTVKTREEIAKCIWKTDEFSNPIMDQLKIDSQVATDEVKDEFLTILLKGEAPESMKSNYAINYRFFQGKIKELINKMPSSFMYYPVRLMNNCILLPIEAESQDTALTIFSTLNNRGLPLSDADIFKAQFYKYYTKKGTKDNFVQRWSKLNTLCEKIFHPITGTPMDELFTKYMYYERAKQRIDSSTTEALRKFYGKDDYAILKNDSTFQNLEDLAKFWEDVYTQNEDRFSQEILRKLYVLCYAPNSMWGYVLSVYYMRNRQQDGLLEEGPLAMFLDKITAFIWSYAVTNPGVNSLRTPIYAEMINIIDGKSVEFEKFKFDKTSLSTSFGNYEFRNTRPITKSMLTWWAINYSNQELPSLETTFDIEHIYARNRNEKEQSLSNPLKVESLGNKAVLEKRINIRASDYRFEDKKKYYNGYTNGQGKDKEGTIVKELIEMSASKSDFTEADIDARRTTMLESFYAFVESNGLMK